MRANRSPAFQVAWTFETDGAHLAAVCHSQAQDVIWVEEAAALLRKSPTRAYFVPLSDTPRPPLFAAILALTPVFRAPFEYAWQRLFADTALRLRFRDGDHEESADWDCRLLEHPETFSILQGHPLAPGEMVPPARWCSSSAVPRRRPACPTSPS